MRRLRIILRRTDVWETKVKHVTIGRVGTEKLIHTWCKSRLWGSLWYSRHFECALASNLNSAAKIWPSKCTQLCQPGTIFIRTLRSSHRRTSNYWIVLGEKTSVYRGTRGSRRSACGPNENLKERLSSCRHYPASLVIFDVMLSANCDINFLILVIQY